MVEVLYTEHSYSFDAIRQDLDDLYATISASTAEITRAQIPATKIMADTIALSGFYAAGDLGAGDVYTIL